MKTRGFFSVTMTLILVLVFAVLSGCSRKPEAAKVAAAKAEATPEAPMTVIVVIAKDCVKGSVFERMRYVKEHGGRISVVYQQAAFIARAPEDLVKEAAEWHDFAVMTGGTEGFDKLDLQDDCRAKMAPMMASWKTMVEKMKEKASSSQTKSK